MGYGRSLLRRGGLSRHEAVARTLPRTCSGATASPPRGPSAGHRRPSRPSGLRSLTQTRETRCTVASGWRPNADVKWSSLFVQPIDIWLIIKYILIGLVERPRSISGEEVPRFFCGENLEGTKRFHRWIGGLWRIQPTFSVLHNNNGVP